MTEQEKDEEGLTYLKWSQFDSPEKGGEGTGKKFMDRNTVLLLDKVVHITKMYLDIELGYTTPHQAELLGLVSFSAHRIGKAVRIRVKHPKKRMRLITGLVKVGIKRIGMSRETIYFDTDDQQPECFNLWDVR